MNIIDNSSLVTLIRPSLLIDKSAVQTVRGVPSLGVAYLAGAIKNAGHRIKIIDGFAMNSTQRESYYKDEFLIVGARIEQIIEQIPEDTLFIGISCMFSSEWIYHRKLIKKVKSAFPEKMIVVGGEHITADPQYVLDSCDAVDICVVGEGEETVIELIQKLESNQEISGIKGIYFRDPQNREKGLPTPPRDRIKKIDEIAWPDWDDYPIDIYLEKKLSLQETTKTSIPMLGSRGCPYKCTFCTNPNMWGPRWISRDAKDIVKEVKTYVNKYGVNYIEFWDLTFLINKKWIHEFCDLLISENLDIQYGLPSGTRSEALDQETLDKLFKSGLKRINFSPESGSDYVLEIIQKKVDRGNFLKIMNMASKSGLYVTSNIVLGFPGERKRDVVLSFKYIIQMVFAGIHDLYLLPYAPYPGSRIFNDLVAKGKIDKKSEDFDYFLAKCHYIKLTGIDSYSDSLSGRTINILFVVGRLFFYFLQFLVRPVRLVKFCKNVVMGKPQTYFERFVIGIYKNFIHKYISFERSPKPKLV